MNIRLMWKYRKYRPPGIIKMMVICVLMLAVIIVGALAQELDEATKIHALKRAYELNGNVMSGWVSLDLSREDLSVGTDPMGPIVAKVEPEKKCKRFRRGKCRE